MSELRDFVADLMERKGAIVEALGPDALAVLAPAPVRTQMGWPELAQLDFGTERPHGAIAIGLEGDWLDRFGALLEDKGRWSERELRLAAVAAPGDPERVLQYALIITGALLVVVMLFFPSGIVIADDRGGVDQRTRRDGGRRHADADRG